MTDDHVALRLMSTVHATYVAVTAALQSSAGLFLCSLTFDFDKQILDPQIPHQLPKGPPKVSPSDVKPSERHASLGAALL